MRRRRPRCVNEWKEGYGGALNGGACMDVEIVDDQTLIFF